MEFLKCLIYSKGDCRDYATTPSECCDHCFRRYCKVNGTGETLD